MGRNDCKVAIDFAFCVCYTIFTMKKFLFAFTAAVAVASACLTFTACGNLANDSVTTKEEWIKAWQDTAAADSYTLVQHLKGAGISDHGTNPSPYDYLVETGYDNVNKVIYCFEHGQRVPEFYEDGYYYEYYLEADGNNVNEYSRYSDREAWRSSVRSSLYNEIADIASAERIIGVSEDGYISDRSTLEELYDYAVYNSKTKTYTLSLATDTFQIQFSGGYLYKLIRSYEMEGVEFLQETTVIDINSTVVTVPEEIKASTGAMTEGYWKQALADSRAALSYSMSGFCTTDTGDWQYRKYDYAILDYDGINGVAYYNQYGHFETRENGKTEVFGEFDNKKYFELSGTSIITYGKAGDGSWGKSTENYATADKAKDNLPDIRGSFLNAEYKIPGSDAAKPLDELFDAFIYSQSFGAFTATVIMVTPDNESHEMEFQINFVNGKVYEIYAAYNAVTEDGEQQTIWFGYIFGDYNSTTASVPAEVKKAAEENKE